MVDFCVNKRWYKINFKYKILSFKKMSLRLKMKNNIKKNMYKVSSVILEKIKKLFLGMRLFWILVVFWVGMVEKDKVLNCLLESEK